MVFGKSRVELKYLGEIQWKIGNFKNFLNKKFLLGIFLACIFHFKTGFLGYAKLGQKSSSHKLCGIMGLGEPQVTLSLRFSPSSMVDRPFQYFCTAHFLSPEPSTLTPYRQHWLKRPPSFRPSSKKPSFASIKLRSKMGIENCAWWYLRAHIMSKIPKFNCHIIIKIGHVNLSFFA